MPRPFEFPDPRDRSPNAPSVMAQAEQIIGLYNQAHPDEDPYVNLAATPKQWFTDEAKRQGWAEANVQLTP